MFTTEFKRESCPFKHLPLAIARAYDPNTVREATALLDPISGRLLAYEIKCANASNTLSFTDVWVYDYEEGWTTRSDRE